MNYPFLQMIKTLRAQEEVILSTYLLQTSAQEQALVGQYLKEEYTQEAWEYPVPIPAFDETAALWAAQTLYTATQLVLYRKHEPTAFTQLFSPFPDAMSPAAVLSADLCLRFMPDLLTFLSHISPEDPLIVFLQKILTQWHYSGVAYRELAITQLDTQHDTFQHTCIQNLYAQRIIQYNRKDLAGHQPWATWVAIALGPYAPVLW